MTTPRPTPRSQARAASDSAKVHAAARAGQASASLSAGGAQSSSGTAHAGAAKEPASNLVTARAPDRTAEVAAAPWLRSRGACEGSGRGALALLIAVLAHGGLVALALQQEVPTPALATVTEVELQPPPPAVTPPPPPPRSEPEPPKAEPAPAAPAPKPARAHAPRPSAPAPAAAAPLRTIDDAVKTAEEPVRFVTDPNGAAFGYGTVARGGIGTGASGAQLPAAPEPSVSGAGGRGSAPVLSRPPSLAESDPCRGFFPARAQADRGEVQLKVRVEADGNVRSVTIARENPAAQGFGVAARDCLLSKHFTPALDVQGAPVSVLSPVTIRFSR